MNDIEFNQAYANLNDKLAAAVKQAELLGLRFEVLQVPHGDPKLGRFQPTFKIWQKDKPKPE